MRAGEVLADGGYQRHRDFVDFIVDGRPPLFQLTDLDAVSPLASDVPPAIFTAQVRSLLLETDAPLEGGRYVIYGCPECEDLACGAVTAVIQRDGTDFIWRDFAWQTDEHADLERNGYHGIGPFRFAGAEYRAALDSLIDGIEPPVAKRRVLLDRRPRGRPEQARRPASHRHRRRHHRRRDPRPRDELRGYGAVAYVDGLAPIVPLLVAQIEHALDRRPAEQHRLTRLVAADGEAGGEVTSPCRVRVTAYRLDRQYRSCTQNVFDGVLEPGRHRIALDAKAVKGESFVVARTAGSVRVEAMAR